MIRVSNKAWRHTWALMWPVMLANLSLPLLGLVDTAVLGHLDDDVYLAGVALGASLIAFVFLGFNFLSMGLSGFTSQAKGANDARLIRTQLAQYSLVAALLSATVLAAQSVLIHLGLGFMQASEAATTEARLYLNIRIWGVPAQVVTSMLLGFFVGMQNTRIALVTVSVAQLVNLVLNVTLVYGFGMTTDGIALGTVISEYLALALVLLTLRRTLKHLSPGLDISRLKTLAAYAGILSVSLSLFIRTFLLLMGFAWFNRLSAALGDTVLASNAILLAFLTLISNSMDASAAAAEAQVGLAIGQRDPQALRDVLWTTGWCAFGLALA
ncbi:MAG: MATE family efflux transporter, partial [Oceanisphaera sp.]|nr:MATE family efflux transporter [Oceanisphaera sp.]